MHVQQCIPAGQRPSPPPPRPKAAEEDALRDDRMVEELRYEDKPHGRTFIVCLLMPVGGSADPLVQMLSCRIKIEKRGLLIRGTEYVRQRKRRDSDPQALWVWPIPPEPMTIRVMPPTSSLMNDLREAMR